MLGISISNKLFGSASGRSHRDHPQPVQGEDQTQSQGQSEAHVQETKVEFESSGRPTNKTTLEEPQSSGTKEIIHSDAHSDCAYDLEQKRKDSIVSDYSSDTGSLWISSEDEERLAKTVGDSVWQIASLQKPQRRSMDETKIFEGEIVPQISLGDYLCRLRKYINRLFPANTKASTQETEWGVSPGMRSVIIALIYIDRLLEIPGGMNVSIYNIHRLSMAAVFVAAKYLEDDALPKRFLANVAGVSTKQLGQIETTFCCKIGFDLRVSEEEFIETYSMIAKQVLR